MQAKHLNSAPIQKKASRQSPWIRGFTAVMSVWLFMACGGDDQPVVGYTNPLTDAQNNDLGSLDSNQDGVLTDTGPGPATTCLVKEDCPSGQLCDPKTKYCYAPKCTPGAAICVGPYTAICGSD